MGVADGTYALGPEVGSILVKTTRTGLGAKVGHDLTLEPTRWRGTAVVDTHDPARSSVTAEVDVDSLEIRQASGGVKPLTDSDRADIKKNLRKALNAGQHPTITFRSTRITGSPESFTIDGDLTIADATQPVSVRGQVTDGRARGGTTIVQSRWGIKPYSAFFGALKLRDEVEVEFDVALTPAATG
jgi:polyisoprenoid-binding protein YceI